MKRFLLILIFLTKSVYADLDEAIAYADAQNEQAMAIGIKCREQDLYLPYNQEGIKEFGLADLN